MWQSYGSMSHAGAEKPEATFDYMFGSEYFVNGSRDTTTSNPLTRMTSAIDRSLAMDTRGMPAPLNSTRSVLVASVLLLKLASQIMLITLLLHCSVKIRQLSKTVHTAKRFKDL